MIKKSVRSRSLISGALLGFTAVLALLVLLSSCGFLTDIINEAIAASSETADAEETASSGSTAPSGAVQTEPEFSYSPDPNEAFDCEAAKRAAMLADPAVAKAYEVLNKTKDRPEISVLRFSAEDYPKAYDSLDESKRLIYDTVLEAVSEGKPYHFDEKKEPAGFVSAFLGVNDALAADHPEIFAYYSLHFSGYEIVPVYFMPNKGSKSAITDPEEIASAIEETSVYLYAEKRILEKMPEGLSDYRKCVYLAACISYSCTYDRELETRLDPFQAYNALVGGRTICQGYTKAFERLARAAGMDCGRVENESGSHTWNVLKTTDGLRYIDVTWTDSTIEDRGLLFTTDYMFIDGDGLLIDGHGAPVPAV